MILKPLIPEADKTHFFSHLNSNIIIDCIHYKAFNNLTRHLSTKCFAQKKHISLLSIAGYILPSTSYFLNKQYLLPVPDTIPPDP